MRLKCLECGNVLGQADSNRLLEADRIGYKPSCFCGSTKLTGTDEDPTGAMYRGPAARKEPFGEIE